MADDSFTSLSRGSFSSSVGDSLELESTNISLSDRLKVFKTSQFEPDNYVTSKCQTMNEKEIRHLCSYMVDLKKASAEEMRRSVFANYPAFIRTSREISDLEGELLSMRNLLSTQAALVHSLLEGIRVDSISACEDDSASNDISNLKMEVSKMENWVLEYLDMLEVLLAERRVDEALIALDEGKNMVEEINHKQTFIPTACSSLQYAITEHRQKLSELLAETICQPFTCGAELRRATVALKKLGDGPRAHTLLLTSHNQKLHSNLQTIRLAQSSQGGAYISAVSQLVFSTIAQAASDSLATFGEEPAFTSELVMWSVKQAEFLALLLKRHVVASSATLSGLRVAANCVHVCLAHCSLLEARGLVLSPILLRHFRPFVEHALSANSKKIGQSTAALAAADDWSLIYSPVGSRILSSTSSLGSVATSQPKLSSTAHRFHTMIQEFLEDVVPLESLQLDTPTLEGVLQLFNSYINLLIKALPASMETEENLEGSANKIVRLAETEAQQIALLANASLLADELLPRAASKLLPLNQSSRMETPSKGASDRQSRLPEQREWKKKLQRIVDRLRDSFCRQNALEIIFDEDGETRLSAQMYLGMDGSQEEPEWFPSLIFQELFAKLTRMASIATDMFVGRERFATILLMRLTETVILFLSDDEGFWEEIEQGPTPLGPLGLQQFYLDMEFVILFTSQGRYLSRNLHQVIKNIIARVLESVAATGVDPYSILPEEDWFAEVAQIAIQMLTGKANYSNLDRDVTSPTASVSAKSISSAHSHGSN